MGSEMVRNYFISEGDYSTEGTHLLLHDRYGMFEMRAEIYPQGVKFISGFPFMKNVAFKGRNSATDKISEYINYISAVWEKWKYPYSTIESLKSLVAPVTFQPGIYCASALWYEHIYVRLNSDRTYDVYYSNKLVSEGAWRQENTCIILRDNNLNCTFYLGILSINKLKQVVLPGLYYPQDKNMTFEFIDNFPPEHDDVPTPRLPGEPIIIPIKY